MKKLNGITLKSIDDFRFLTAFGKKATIPLLEVYKDKEFNAILVDIREYSSYDKSSQLVAGPYLLRNHIIFDSGDVDLLTDFIKENIGNKIYIAASEVFNFTTFIKNIN